MAEKYTSPVLVNGVRESVVRFVTSVTPAKIIYAAESYASDNIKELKIAMESESTKISASNVLIGIVSAAKSCAVELELAFNDEEVKAKMLGRTFSQTKNKKYSVSSAGIDGRPIEFAFTTEIPTSTGGAIFICFPKLKANKELESVFKDSYKGYEESPEKYSFEAMPSDVSREFFIHTGEILPADIVKVRTAWRANPPQSNAEALALVETATTI